MAGGFFIIAKTTKGGIHKAETVDKMLRTSTVVLASVSDAYVAVVSKGLGASGGSQ